jgi:hypothetical protein
MPKQWERELQKVNSLRAPASTRVRIESGPRGDGMPPSPGRAQRVLAGAVALAVFAGALLFVMNAFAGRSSVPPASGGDAVTFTFSIAVPGPGAIGYPQATMQVGDQAVNAWPGPYTWDGMHASPSKDAPFDEWTDVPGGASIVIGGSAEHVQGWVGTCCDVSYPNPPPHISELDLTTGAQIPTSRSRYVLEFSASWAQGSGSFFFPIRVVSESEPSPTADPAADDFTMVATMSTPPDGSAPGLELSYDGIEKSYPGAGRWADEPALSPRYSSRSMGPYRPGRRCRWLATLTELTFTSRRHRSTADRAIRLPSMCLQGRRSCRVIRAGTS